MPDKPVLVQDLTIVLSVLTVLATAVNVYVSLRLAALQSRFKAESAALEVALLKQLVQWKDEVLSTINGKYVSATLIAEIRTNVGHELQQLERRVDRVEERCAAARCASRREA